MNVGLDGPRPRRNRALEIAWDSEDYIGRQKGKKNGGKGTYVRNFEVDVGSGLGRISSLVSMKSGRPQPPRLLRNPSYPFLPPLFIAFKIAGVERTSGVGEIERRGAWLRTRQPMQAVETCDQMSASRSLGMDVDVG